MLLQTNTYIVPREKRAEHARLMRRFRQMLAKLGCDQFEVYEQVGANFSPFKSGGRFVQFMRFRDRKHHQAVQEAERNHPEAQDLIREFCQLLDLEYQKSRSLFAVGFYSGILTTSAVTEIVPAEEVADEPAAFDAPALESRDFTTVNLDPAAQQEAVTEFQSRTEAPGASDGEKTEAP